LREAGSIFGLRSGWLIRLLEGLCKEASPNKASSA
jgi:hypothetical protein